MPVSTCWLVRCGSLLRGWLPLLLVMLAQARAQAAASEHVVLVLAVMQEGRYQDRWTMQVSDFLQRAGLPLAARREVRPTDRKCAAPACLHEIAGRTQASLVLVASVEHHTSQDRYLVMSLFDTRSGRDTVLQDACEQKDVEQRLKDLSAKLISPYLADPEQPPAAPAATAPSSPAEAQAAAPPPLPASTKPAAPGPGVDTPTLARTPTRRPDARPAPARPRSRKLTAGLLFGFSALSLGAAIPLTVLQGQMLPPSIRTCPQNLATDCVQDYRALWIPGYVLGAGLATAAILTLTLPRKRSQ